MRIGRLSPIGKQAGSMMVLVLVFLVISLFGAIVVLGWTQNSSRLTEHHNQYHRSVAAAEAATEKILSQIACDYQNQGESLVLAHLNTYRTQVPTVLEDPAWAKFEFQDALGMLNRTYVQNLNVSEFRQLSSQYRGLRGYATTLRIISNARERNGSFRMTGGVKQDIQVATIPLFQFAIFYNLDMEINPGPDMTISGPVHCNTNIYLQPQATLRFASDVTAGAEITLDKKPNDPVIRTPGTVIFDAEHDARASSLTLPIGTNSCDPNAVREVVEMPPAGESATSPMGKERYYNKADMVIQVTDSGTTVTSGSANNFATAIPASEFTNFIDTTVTFFNKRENKTVKTTQIDIAKLLVWNAGTNALRAILPTGNIKTIYVADTRTQTGTTESGVKLVNGETLLPEGLTVATPNPAYIRGHFNSPVASRGTGDTTQTVPASIVADAITVLSAGWNDNKGGSGIGERKAQDTTVNAAFMTGIVPTVTSSYSGGVENLPRLLEDWGSRTFTYNGSMVVLYESRYATGPWLGTGSIYNPPTRNWTFDTNFRDPSKLPPGCPSVRAMIRSQWATIKPRTTS